MPWSIAHFFCFSVIFLFSVIVLRTVFLGPQIKSFKTFRGNLFRVADFKTPKKDDSFIDFIKKSFPHVHNSSRAIRFELQHGTFLHYIKGSNADLKPYLLSSDLNAIPELINQKRSLFQEQLIDDGYIHGRGSVDPKFIITSIFEAVENLIKEDFVPKRSFYIAFSCNAETSTERGAYVISKFFQERNIKLEFVLDEGTFILPGSAFHAITDQIAVIGVTEKGFATLNLSVNSDAGHSSMSQDENAPVILSTAISKLKQGFRPHRFEIVPELNLLEAISPHLKFSHRIFSANSWLFSYLISRYLEEDRMISSLFQTTASVTMFRSGYKENVIPSTAWATINFWIHPSSNSIEVYEHTKHTVNDDRVTIEMKNHLEPHPVSPHGKFDFGYQIIKMTIEEVYNSIAVVPGMSMKSLQSTTYLPVTKAIYRFGPITLTFDKNRRLHCHHDEKQYNNNYEQAIHFYYKLIKNSDSEVMKNYRDYRDL